MTDDEIRRKIAELKGCYWWEIDGISYLCGMSHAAMLPKGTKKVENPTEGYRRLYRVKNWPVNIADAWELVEEMRNEHEIDIASDKLSDGSSTYCMKIFTFRGDNKGTGWKLEHITTADTAPRAICLAWISWKEAQK